MYGDLEEHQFETLVRPILQMVGVRETHRGTGLSLGAVSAVLARGARPRAISRQRYFDFAVNVARSELLARGQQPANHPEALLAQYRAETQLPGAFVAAGLRP